jgi:hypothetical protein
MLEEQIGLMQEQNDLTIAQFQESMRLADEQHQLERDIALQKLLWSEQDLELARQRAKEDEIILGWQRQTTQASYFYAFYQAQGYDAAVKAKPELADMARAAGSLADNMERYARALADGREGSGDGGTPFGGGSPNFAQEMPQFARGGYTGDGATSEVAGIVHRGEYVVPSGGALVIRDSDSSREAGSAEVVNLLTAILVQLQAGGGTILIDEDKLKRAGFIHADNFSQVYR